MSEIYARLVPSGGVPQLLSNSSSYFAAYVRHSQDDTRDIRQILFIAAAAAAAAAAADDDDDAADDDAADAADAADADADAASLPITQLMMFI